MAAPTTEDFADLKRVGRYLLGKPRVIQKYNAGPKKKYLDCYTDSDWAGCMRTRRSTSGGGILWGSHCIKTWASTQASVALSSGEAEFYSLVKGASIAMEMRALMREFGITVDIRMHTDSSAAKGIASRTGLGKTRHIAVHLLWIQEKGSRQRHRTSQVQRHGEPCGPHDEAPGQDHRGHLCDAVGIDCAHWPEPSCASCCISVCTFAFSRVRV